MSYLAQARRIIQQSSPVRALSGAKHPGADTSNRRDPSPPEVLVSAVSANVTASTATGLQRCAESDESAVSPAAVKLECPITPKGPLATDADDDERFICRAIECDLGLPPGSLTLWEPIR
jgi:hypothetical protein